eukprot:3927627-Rhodomonas_salina.2
MAWRDQKCRLCSEQAQGPGPGVQVATRTHLFCRCWHGLSGTEVACGAPAAMFERVRKQHKLVKFRKSGMGELSDET